MSDSLLRGHAAFRDAYVPRQRDFLSRLASEHQNPGALFIGCSDSRVVPELLTSSNPGDLFVVRNVANLVPPLGHVDSSVGAAIEYAVGALGVGHIVVCGHTRCGGIHALLDDHDLRGLPSVAEWLEVARPAVEAADKGGPDHGWAAAVEANVLLQVEHLMSFPLVAERVAADQLDLHGWVYDLAGARLLVYDVQQRAFVPPDQVCG